ncbi:MAG TPA: fused MFS/spermidine synthase [Thermoanaerobaculia bacterium]|nr:fused MFS/spermidine synthase [Thermoanaerobaculia bacterium]
MPRTEAPDRESLIAAVAYANLVSLAAQVIWVRKITLLFGATAGVFASVLAVVLAGLACGAAWGGRRSASEARPERLLAILLVVLGVLCAASLPLLDIARSLFLLLAPEGLAPAARAAVRIPVVALVLLPPTFAIGAILPLATRLYSRDAGDAVASLYAADTLGAACGALIGGFFLVPRLGLSVSTWLLGAGAVALAVAFWKSAPPPVRAEASAPPVPQKKAGKTAPAEPSIPQPRELSSGVRRAVLASFFLTGAAALLLETGWNRFFYLLNGTSIFSLSTVLAGFLTGIGLGSALVRRRLERGGDVPALVAFLQAMVALGGILVFRARELFERTYLALYEATASHAAFQLKIYLTVFALVALATLAMGANFPAVVRLMTPRRDDEAGTLGRVYFVNTAGAVAGALAGEFLILPRFGFDGLLATVTLIYLASAALFLSLAAPAIRRYAAIPVGIVGLAALLITPPLRAYEPPWNAVYYSGVRQGTYAKYRDLNRFHTVVYRRQGFYGQVTVTQTPTDFYLKHNGKTDASTNVVDSFAQYLLGHVPLLLHPKPERVVNIGLGGGITLGAIAAHPEPKEIVQVELDPLVVEATRTWFGNANHRALDDPRVRLVVDDGRSFVERGTDQFDVIISEPPNIWVSGVSGLFTTEFYRAARARLKPGGLLCQWLPLYELGEEDFATALATMGTQFKHLAAWTNGSVAVIVASNEPLPLQGPHPSAAQLPPPPAIIATDLQNAGVAPWQVEQFLSQPDLDAAAIQKLQAEAQGLNRDDRPVLEFRSAANLFRLTKPGADTSWRARLPRTRG